MKGEDREVVRMDTTSSLLQTDKGGRWREREGEELEGQRTRRANQLKYSAGEGTAHSCMFDGNANAAYGKAC